jgi:hypothetical protein
MNTIVREVSLGDFTAEIYFDPDPSNPREWGSPFTMACFHRNYRLGDEHDFDSPRELEEFVARKDVISLPLYLYDHSGITMSTGPFGCSWDSGQVGHIYITAEQARKEFGWKHITKARRDQLYQYLESNVAVYDQYLTGDVYGYVIKNADGEEIDSCWGFYGDEHINEEVRRLMTHYSETMPKQYELTL